VGCTNYNLEPRSSALPPRGIPAWPGSSSVTPREDPAPPSGRCDADERFMAAALDEARLARDLDEVPVGAVVVLDGHILGRGHNQTRGLADPTAHGEMLAIRAASQALGTQRLVGASLYTTLEPCFMCAGAASHARLARVIFGARDPKFGACVSLGRVLSDTRQNHQVEITEGVAAAEARDLLQLFFQSKRGGGHSAG